MRPIIRWCVATLLTAIFYAALRDTGYAFLAPLPLLLAWGPVWVFEPKYVLEPDLEREFWAIVGDSHG